METPNPQRHLQLNKDVVADDNQHYVDTVAHFRRLDSSSFKLSPARVHHLIKRN